MGDDRELLRLHLATLFAWNGEGRMTVTNEPRGRPAPRLFLGRTEAGNVWCFGHDVPPDVSDALERLCSREPDSLDSEEWDPAPFVAVLAEHQPVKSVWHGPAYRFPSELPESACTVAVTERKAAVLRPEFDEWRDDIGRCRPMVAVVKDGQAVSVCATVRSAGHACEAGVETLARYRGRGYAGHAVASWANAVRREGRVPLYSTSCDNEASLAVARKLGLVQYATTFHVT